VDLVVLEILLLMADVVGALLFREFVPGHIILLARGQEVILLSGMLRVLLVMNLVEHVIIMVEFMVLEVEQMHLLLGVKNLQFMLEMEVLLEPLDAIMVVAGLGDVPLSEIVAVDSVELQGQ
jgi:hypothetical protein